MLTIHLLAIKFDKTRKTCYIIIKKDYIMAYKHIKLEESVLPKSLGVKGKNLEGIRYYTIDGVNMPSVTSILNLYSEQGSKIEAWRNAVNRTDTNYISVSVSLTEINLLTNLLKII